MSGLSRVSTASHSGRPVIGNSDPDRNIIGMISSWLTGMAAWMVLIRVESRTPSAVSSSAPRNRQPISGG